MDKLEAKYFDPAQPGSYSGINALTRTSKLKPAQVRKWLSEQDAYTLHKPIRRRFQRRRVIVGGIDHQWQADLVDISRLAKHNNGVKFLLTCIDVFSKYAWVLPLGNKTGDSLIKAFVEILKSGRKPQALQTDKGTEFTNKKFQNFLKSKSIHFFSTHNTETNASIVERFNRTLKNRMWRYFTKHNVFTYLPVLNDMVEAYNHTYHRSIKRTPVSVKVENEEDTWLTLYGDYQDIKPPKFESGDRVRISRVRGNFQKGYLPNWSEELFTVHNVKKGIPTVYVLVDDNKEMFYTQLAEDINLIHCAQSEED